MYMNKRPLKALHYSLESSWPSYLAKHNHLKLCLKRFHSLWSFSEIVDGHHTSQDNRQRLVTKAHRMNFVLRLVHINGFPVKFYYAGPGRGISIWLLYHVYITLLSWIMQLCSGEIKILQTYPRVVYGIMDSIEWVEHGGKWSRLKTHTCQI